MSAFVQSLFVFIALAIIFPPIYAQEGFLSLDCGAPRGTRYVDEETGITYISDADYIPTGESRTISINFTTASTKRRYKTLRSFSVGGRNCYTLRPVERGGRYLLRAGFVYGDYDGRMEIPSFNVYLGLFSWIWVAQMDAGTLKWSEIIVTAESDYIPVCVMNTNTGTPFISTLELRQLEIQAYNFTGRRNSLVLMKRYDVGSNSGETIRFRNDMYDRLWEPLNQADWVSINTTGRINNQVIGLNPPVAAMATAVSPLPGEDTLRLNWTAVDSTAQFHVFRYFTEFELNDGRQVREFRTCIEGLPNFCSTFRPLYVETGVVYNILPLSGHRDYTFTFQRTNASTLPPILNAMEIYQLIEPTEMGTYEQDVDAIMGVKEEYKVEKNWMGDPCVPINFTWQGLNCSRLPLLSPVITSLNLSFSGLSGPISSSIEKLTYLISIDLSGNNLTGEIPNFLANLPSLSTLNLSNNNQLNGSVPAALLERSTNGSLRLSVDGNPNLCTSAFSCTSNSSAARTTEKKQNVVTRVAISVSAFILIVLIILTVAFYMRRRFRMWFRPVLGIANSGPNMKSNDSISLENRRFTAKEITSMTNDYETVIGRGGFGTVYLGCMKDGTQVAVKLLSLVVADASEFLTEAQLLIKVNHKNLVRFIGYCSEDRIKALVLEYMAKGNLGKLLLDKSGELLSWAQRIQIALNIAQGLEYLHIGCNPHIIHRDVKASNILLNENLEAKIADFGVSKVFFPDQCTHVSTAVKGTFGYLDPEYHIFGKLTEKSDVYSFGIVLLELITGRAAINKISEEIPEEVPEHLLDWVSPLISKGDIEGLVDYRLEGEFDANSAWKAVEVAMACTPPKSIQRPTMSLVVTELKACLGVETLAYTSQESSVNIQPSSR